MSIRVQNASRECGTFPTPRGRRQRLHSFVDIGTGDDFACGLTASGDSITFTSLSVGYQSVCGLTKIYDGRLHECGLEAHGKAWCWGRRDAGSLGDGYTGGVPNEAVQVLPTAVLGDLGFADLAVSDAMITYGTTCGITLGGEAYCWGAGAHEELGAAATDVCAVSGRGELPCAPRPVRLETLERFSEISIGSMHACGVTLRHDVYCGGTNSDGQLGTGTTNVEPVPTAIRLP